VARDEGDDRMNSDTTEPQGNLTIRTLAMPADTNPAGDIFGGWVMSQMDIAGAIAAIERAKGRVVTVAVEAMTFISPVKVGDILCVYTSIERVGRTSITVAVEAWARRNRLDDRVKVTDGRFVYVALGEDGKKRNVSASSTA
jgi:acyl-CoA thioesterase YciA